MCGGEEGTLPKGMSLIALQVYSNHCPYYCITLFLPLSLSRSPTTASSPLLVLTQSQTIGTRCRRGDDDANLVCHHRPLRFRKSPIPHCSPEPFGALWSWKTRKPTSKEGAAAHLIAAILILIHIHISPTSSTAAASASSAAFDTKEPFSPSCIHPRYALAGELVRSFY